MFSFYFYKNKRKRRRNHIESIYVGTKIVFPGCLFLLVVVCLFYHVLSFKIDFILNNQVNKQTIYDLFFCFLLLCLYNITMLIQIYRQIFMYPAFIVSFKFIHFSSTIQLPCMCMYVHVCRCACVLVCVCVITQLQLILINSISSSINLFLFFVFLILSYHSFAHHLTIDYS